MKFWKFIIICMLITISSSSIASAAIYGCSNTTTEYLEYDTFSRADSASLGSTEGQSVAYEDNNAKILQQSFTYDSGEAYSSSGTIAGLGDRFWVGLLFNITGDNLEYYAPTFKDGATTMIECESRDGGANLNCNGAIGGQTWYTVFTNADANAVNQIYMNFSIDDGRQKYNVSAHNQQTGALIGTAYTELDIRNAGTIDRFGIISNTVTTWFLDEWWVRNGTDCAMDSVSPAVTLDSPTDNNISNKDVNFTFNLLNTGADSCSLYGDWTGIFEQNATITSPIAGDHDFGKQGIGTTPGTYLWNVMCSVGATEYWGVNRTLIIDLAEPNIILNSTHSDFYTNGYSTPHGDPYNRSIRYFFDLYDNRDLAAYAVNVTDNLNANVYSFGNSSLSGTHAVAEGRIDTSTWTWGNYTIEVQAADSHTNNNIKDYMFSKYNSRLRYDTAEGNIIWIESEDDSKVDTTKFKDHYEFEFEFSDKQTRSRIFHVKSNNRIKYLPNSIYKAHFVVQNGVAGNWIDFEGVSGKPIIKKINDFHYTVSFISVPSIAKFRSIGGLNVNTVKYSFFQGTYNSSAPGVASGESATIVLNITGNRKFVNATMTANLTYNGTLYTGVVSSVIDPDLINNPDHFYMSLSKIITTPSEGGTYYYHWDVNVEQPDGTSLEFTTGTAPHSVYTWALDNCGTQVNKTLLFSMFDEQDPTLTLNGTWEFSAEYWITDPTNSRNYSSKVEDSSNLTFCISHEMQADMYLKYSTTYGFTHRYYLYNRSLTSTQSIIDVYNFNTTTDISSLQLTTRNVDTYDHYSGIIGKLMRFYPDENVYRPVQMYQSGGFGLMVFNIEEVSADYKIVFTDTSNNILRELSQTSYKCLSSVCELNVLIAPLSEVTITTTTGVSYSYDNSTGLITIVWNEPSGDAIDITYSIDWVRSDGFVEICSQSARAVEGTFTCNVSGYYGTAYLTLNSTKSGSTYQDFGELISLASIRLHSVLSQADASLWSFIILLPVILAGLASPVIALISAMLGLIILFYIGMLSFLSVGVLILYAIGGVALGLLIKT